jgi:hypothetical protein
MKKNQKKNYTPALAFKLHKGWASDGTVERCDKIYTQGKIKIFYPEMKAWHNFLKMIKCPKRFAGLFVNHMHAWIPHIAIAAKLGLRELETFKMLSELHDDADAGLGQMYETYGDRLPKTRRKALWLNVDDLEVLDFIGCFKGATWAKWQHVVDLMADAEDYYQEHPWAQTKMGLNLHGNINFQDNAITIFFIEARLIENMPYRQMSQAVVGKGRFPGVLTVNDVPFTEHTSKAIAQAHIEKYYANSKLNLFNGLAG